MSAPVEVGRYLDWINQTENYQRHISVLDLYETTDFQTEDHSSSRVNGHYTQGGNFLLWKNGSRVRPSAPVAIYRHGARKKPAYVGSLCASVPKGPPPSSSPALDDYGPEAIARASPDKPYMAIPNAAYELKDVPGMLKQKFEINNLKSIADYNVAIQFGWLPLLNDCISLYHAQTGLQKKLQQLVRDNGKPVHRGFDLNNQKEDEVQLEREWEASFPEIDQTFVAQCYNGSSLHRLDYYSKTRVWFSGQCRFWLPDTAGLTESQWNAKVVRRMLGLYVSPAFIYNAMPWSWLIDWCSNVGDNIANLNANVADRLIWDYAFLMRHREFGQRFTVQAGVRLTPEDTDTVTRVSCQSESYRSRKERVGASPFGFRVKTEDLTNFQTNILTSLAIGRIAR